MFRRQTDRSPQWLTQMTLTWPHHRHWDRQDTFNSQLSATAESEHRGHEDAETRTSINLTFDERFFIDRFSSDGRTEQIQTLKVLTNVRFCGSSETIIYKSMTIFASLFFTLNDFE